MNGHNANISTGRTGILACSFPARTDRNVRPTVSRRGGSCAIPKRDVAGNCAVDTGKGFVIDGNSAVRETKNTVGLSQSADRETKNAVGLSRSVDRETKSAVGLSRSADRETKSAVDLSRSADRMTKSAVLVTKKVFLTQTAISLSQTTKFLPKETK